jgi:hypothetical protein
MGPTAVKNGTRPFNALVCAGMPQATVVVGAALSIVAYIA